jgi:hypothetical protein
MPRRCIGGGGIAPRILDLGTRRRWVASFAPRPLYPRYPLDRRLGGPQSRSGGCVVEIPSPCRDSNLRTPTVQVSSRYTEWATPALHQALPRHSEPHGLSQIKLERILGNSRIFYGTSRRSWLRLFLVFLSPFRQMLWQCITLDHDRTLHALLISSLTNYPTTGR